MFVSKPSHLIVWWLCLGGAAVMVVSFWKHGSGPLTLVHENEGDYEN